MPALPRFRLKGLTWAPLILALVGGGWAISGPRRTARPVVQRAWWYWHHPFRLSNAEERSLHRAGCSRLYVHAGTIEARQGHLALTSPQRFLSASPCGLFAVLRVHPAAHGLLLSPEGPAQFVGLLQAARLPAEVRGVQVDADIPTARLGEYARFLAAVRPQLPTGWKLSVTALPDWLGNEGYARVCDAVDEVAPQFYGNRWPVAGRKPPPLWETAGLARQAKQAVAGRAQVWIGLPSYGRCVVLDPQGRPVGVRHDLDPEALLESSDWVATAAETRSEPSRSGDELALEESFTLRAGNATNAGPLAVEAGTSLWFQWPRVEALQRAEQELIASPTPGFLGVCYFRWPAPGEPLALLPQPQTATAPATPFDLVVREAEAGVQLVLRNRGIDGPRLPDGVHLELTGDVSEVETDRSADYRCGDSHCSPLRADRVRFTRPLLRPGSEWTVCRLRNRSAPITARLSWRDGLGRPQSTETTLSPEMETP